MSEPEYVDPDDPFGDHSYKGRQRPKWTMPKTKAERDLLSAVGRKYYVDHAHRAMNLMITKAMISLTSGVISKFPTEWVEDCCRWAIKMRKSSPPIPIDWKGLLTAIHNDDRKNKFVERWLHKRQIEAHSEEDLYGSKKQWLDDE